jgi:methylmalonyl-CoA mutase N-terminal domain/subunit
MKQTYGAKDIRSLQLRIFAFTAGSSLTAQQPLNNVVRASLEATAAALAGVQTMHVSAYDEALGVPTESAATLALRTQQVVAFESGLTTTLDPFGGSYAVEALTDELEAEIMQLSAQIEQNGGALTCIESGWFAQELSDAAYRYTQSVESGARTVVGVNKFPAASEPLDIFRVDPAAESGQIRAVTELRGRRDVAAVKAALGELRDAASAGDNILPTTIAAVTVYATIGEIVDVLLGVHGAWVPTAHF